MRSSVITPLAGSDMKSPELQQATLNINPKMKGLQLAVPVSLSAVSFDLRRTWTIHSYATRLAVEKRRAADGEPCAIELLY